MTCLLINSPKTGDQIQSNLYDSLLKYTNNEVEANELFNKVITPKFIEQFGDWTENNSILGVDNNGELILDNTLKEILIRSKNINNLSTLKSKATEFIKNMGFKYEEISEILTDGLESVTAVTDFLTQTVSVIEGADTGTLIEEAGHVYVEMLEQKESPLFASIMNDIVKFKEYQDVKNEYGDEYKGDETKLRKEAIGKAIRNHIIRKQTDDNTPRIEGWFNRVKVFLKDLFNTNSEQLNSFLNIAENVILNGNETQILKPIDYKLYDITPKTQRIIDKLKDVDSKLTKREVSRDGKIVEKYFYQGVEVAKRVSDSIDAYYKKIFGKNLTDEEKSKWEENRLTGVLGHGDLENIVNRYVQKIKDLPIEADTTSLKTVDKIYLEKFISKLIAPFAENSTILTEVKIVDKDGKEAGTIDLLVIEPNGTVHIFDYKFIESGKEISKVKKDAWNLQLNKYRDILEKNYNIKSFGQMRMLAIETNYENGKYKSLKIDGTELAIYVQPAKVEKTKSKELNLVLTKLYEELNKLENKGGAKTPTERELLNKNINYITKAINDIQVKEDLSLFLINADAKLTDLTKKLNSDILDKSALLEAINVNEFYSNMISLGLTKYETDESKKRISVTNVSEKAQQFNQIIKFKLDEYISTLQDTNEWFSLEDLKTNGFGNNFTTLAQFSNPVYRVFNDLKEKAANRIDKEFKEMNEILISQIRQSQLEEGSSDTFAKILQKDKNGKLTGNLINKFKQDFYNGLELKSNDWIFNNIKFRVTKEEFEKEAKAYYEDLLKTDKLREAPETETRKEFEKWLYKNDFWHDKYKNSAIKNFKEGRKTHRFIEPNEIWQTDDYKYIKTNPNKGISKLYETFVDILDQAKEFSPYGISSNFIPSIEKSFVQKILTNGMNMSNLKHDIVDDLTMKSYEQSTDSNGNIIHKIPLKYTNELKGEKSLDLGNVFSLFYHSVLQNKYLSEIEEESNLLTEVVKQGEYYETNPDGSFKYKDGSKIRKIINDDNETVTQLKRFVNYYVYQVKNESPDLEIAGVSMLKLLEKAQSYYSRLNLGFNVFSAFANIIGGGTNAYFVAAKGKWFTSGDLLKAQGLITSRDKKATSLVEFFDIMSDENAFKKAKELSTSNATKYASLDNIYALQRVGEYFIQNSTLIAFLKGNTIKDGEIKKTEQGDKSIYELVSESKEGKIEVQGLTEDIYNSIRKRVRGLNNEILGSLSERDILLAQQHFLGRIMLQFKRWTLPMGKARFGSITYNSNLEDFEEGRLRQAFKTLFDKRFFPLVTNMISATFTGKANTTLGDKIEEMYNEIIAQNPNFENQISLEKYTEMYLENLKANGREIASILMFTGMLLSMNKPDDDDNTKTDKFLIHTLRRSANEITYWYSTDSFTSLGSFSPPIFGIISRIQDLGTEISKAILTNDKTDIKNKASKLVIGWNTYNKFEDQISTINEK